MKHTPLVQHDGISPRHEADLMTIARPEVEEQAYSHATPLMVTVVVLVSTIVVFRVVPSLLARLVISGVVGVASACTLAPDMLASVNNVRQSKRTIGM